MNANITPKGRREGPDRVLAPAASSYELQFLQLLDDVMTGMGSNVPDERSKMDEAADDIASTLELEKRSIYLIAWFIQNMGTTKVYSLEEIHGLTSLEVEEIDAFINVLEARRYLIPVKYMVTDLTCESKRRLINHYCFRKLVLSH